MLLFTKIFTNPSGLDVGLGFFYFQFGWSSTLSDLNTQPSLSLVLGHQGGWALMGHPDWAGVRQDHRCQEVMFHFILTTFPPCRCTNSQQCLIPAAPVFLGTLTELNQLLEWEGNEFQKQRHILMDQRAGSAPQPGWKTKPERGWESWLAAAARGGGRREKRNEMASVSSTKPTEDPQREERKMSVMRLLQNTHIQRNAV